MFEIPIICVAIGFLLTFLSLWCSLEIILQTANRIAHFPIKGEKLPCLMKISTEDRPSSYRAVGIGRSVQEGVHIPAS